MDKRSLETEVAAFQEECARRGRSIEKFCLNEAYPGDSSTSYILQLKASWVKDDECFRAIDFFTDVMFDVMSLEARKLIFSIQVLQSNNALHCESGEIDHSPKRAS